MRLFNRSMVLLERALRLRLQGHNLIASNLANMDTPGYTAKSIDFEAELKRAMEVQPVSLSAVEAAVEPPGVTPQVMEGGPVDLDREMAALAKNGLMYDAVAQSLAKRFELLKYAIGEGGK